MKDILNLALNEAKKLKRYRITVVGVLSVMLTIAVSCIQITAMKNGGRVN